MLGWWLVAALAAGLAGGASGLAPHSVSGFSSGGDLALIHAVVHARAVTGLAVAAGAPYGCQLLETRPLQRAYGDPCGWVTGRPPWKAWLSRLGRYMARRHADGLIDNPANLSRTPVLLFSGKEDYVVSRGVVRAVERQLRQLVAPSLVRTEYTVPAAHAWVTDNPNRPGCGTEELPNVNYCKFDLAGVLLQHSYGRLNPRAARLAGELRLLEQAPHTPPGWSLQSLALASQAFVFVPAQCLERAGRRPCTLHVNYHGCRPGGSRPHGLHWAERTGLNEWAATNRMVVFYPQVANQTERNPMGCWDWDGSVTRSELFDTNRGPQLSAVIDMVRHLQHRAAAGTLGELPAVRRAE